MWYRWEDGRAVEDEALQERLGLGPDVDWDAALRERGFIRAHSHGDPNERPYPWVGAEIHTDQARHVNLVCVGDGDGWFLVVEVAGGAGFIDVLGWVLPVVDRLNAVHDGFDELARVMAFDSRVTCHLTDGEALDLGPAESSRAGLMSTRYRADGETTTFVPWSAVAAVVVDTPNEGERKARRERDRQLREAKAATTA